MPLQKKWSLDTAYSDQCQYIKNRIKVLKNKKDKNNAEKKELADLQQALIDNNHN